MEKGVSTFATSGMCWTRSCIWVCEPCVVLLSTSFHLKKENENEVLVGKLSGQINPFAKTNQASQKRKKPQILESNQERKFVSFIFIQSHIISGDLNEASNSYAQYSLLTRLRKDHTCHLHRYRCSSRLIKKTFSSPLGNSGLPVFFSILTNIWK